MCALLLFCLQMGEGTERYKVRNQVQTRFKTLPAHRGTGVELSTAWLHEQVCLWQ
jgi:hypothetical protein